MHAELFAHHSLVRLTRALRAAVLRRAVSSHLSPVWPATQQPSALRVEHWSYASHRSRRPRPCLLTKTKSIPAVATLRVRSLSSRRHCGTRLAGALHIRNSNLVLAMPSRLRPFVARDEDASPTLTIGSFAMMSARLRMRPNPSLERTLSGLRPPRAAQLKR